MKIYNIGNDCALAQRLKSVKATKEVVAEKEIINDTVINEETGAGIPETVEASEPAQTPGKNRKQRLKEAKKEEE